METKEKTWIIIPNLTIGKTNHFDQKVTTIRHYFLSSNNKLTACQGCRLKDNTLKTKTCFFQYNTGNLYTIQVDSHRYLHANIADISLALKKAIPTYTAISTTRKLALPRPLTAFSTFLQHI